jgi:hypothetical protein
LAPLRRLSNHEVLSGWVLQARRIEISAPYRTRAEAAAAEIEAIKTEKPLYNFQHAENPIEPPTAPAMMGVKLRRRLKAARRRGEIREGTFESRIASGLAELRQDLKAPAGEGEG